jgi:phosphate:Na+ symporter
LSSYFLSQNSILDWFSIFLGAVMGLVLFIYAITLLSNSLKATSQDKVKSILTRFTNNRFSGVLTGTGATIIIGSSSVTTVTVIALVNAGLLPFAFDLGKYAPVIVLIGFVASFLKQESISKTGKILFALGLIFFSLDYISQSVAPLKGYQPFLNFLETFQNPWLGVLAGALFTFSVQSSSATMGTVIALSMQGLMTLPAATAIMLGAEIGTCGSSLIASIGRSQTAIRTGLFHLLFNVSTVLIGVFFIDELIAIATWISGNASLERKIANAHAIFNIGGMLLFIGFTPYIAAQLGKLNFKKLASIVNR